MRNRLFLLALLVLVLGACGQRGPLYLPDPQSRTALPATQPASLS